MKWISVKETPIPQNEWVMGYCTYVKRYDGESHISNVNMKVLKLDGDADDNDSWATSNNTCGCCNYGLVVTHWMPLPEPPECIKQDQCFFGMKAQVVHGILTMENGMQYDLNCPLNDED